MSLVAISMFSGAGIGDTGLSAAGYDVIAANEISQDRAALYALNFPDTKIFVDDAWNTCSPIIEFVNEKLRILNEPEVFLFIATPPCQGMSQNGAGTILNNVRKGQRPRFDPRNRLIIPALKVAQATRPRWVVFENVIGMKHTVIEDEDGSIKKIVDLIPHYLGSEYEGGFYAVEFADYGLPQRRQRLISVYTRDETAKRSFRCGAKFVPDATHDAKGLHGRKKWINLSEVLTGFRPLDAINAEKAVDPTNRLHRVPVLDPKKYEWIRHTPKKGSAFDNQCINPECGFQENPTHGTTRGEDGINRANRGTPLHCVKCAALLPRPYTKETDGTLRIMSGYTSAYKRMCWDLPSPTLTQNLSYPCSDHKVHPSENRVLSLAEACKLQSISDYNYKWGSVVIRGKKRDIAPDTVIKDCIGESVPPLFTEILGRHLAGFAEGEEGSPLSHPEQKALFGFL